MQSEVGGENLAGFVYFEAPLKINVASNFFGLVFLPFCIFSWSFCTAVFRLQFCKITGNSVLIGNTGDGMLLQKLASYTGFATITI